MVVALAHFAFGAQSRLAFSYSPDITGNSTFNPCQTGSPEPSRGKEQRYEKQKKKKTIRDVITDESI